MFVLKKRKKIRENDEILKKSKLIAAIREIDKSSQRYYTSEYSCKPSSSNILNNNENKTRNDEDIISSHDNESHNNEESNNCDVDNELIYQQHIRSDSSPEEIFTRIVGLIGNIIHNTTSLCSINKNILNFLEQKVDMIKLKEVLKECNICSEKSKIVNTKCCNFQICKRCFIKWVYENSSRKMCNNYTCPHCRCNEHESIDIRFFQLMKEIC